MPDLADMTTLPTAYNYGKTRFFSIKLFFVITQKLSMLTLKAYIVDSNKINKKKLPGARITGHLLPFSLVLSCLSLDSFIVSALVTVTKLSVTGTHLCLSRNVFILPLSRLFMVKGCAVTDHVPSLPLEFHDHMHTPHHSL